MSRFITKQCLQCNSDFKADIYGIKRGFSKFCSLKCATKFNGNLRPNSEPNVTCAHCQKKFYKNASKLKLSKSGLHFCCREHKDSAQSVLRELYPSHHHALKTSYRKIAFLTYPKICQRCNYSNELATVVHHKDRNRNNNDISNLEVLCANCHMIEHQGHVGHVG